MASIERTAYPRFRRVVPLRELHEVYEPSLDELTWARGLARSPEHLLVLVVLLKCFQRLGYSFAGESWLRVVRDHHRPGQLLRRHLEVCVFSHLADELRTGDIAVAGADAYANYLAQLLSWEECEPLVADYCAEAGLPATAGEFVEALRRELTEVAARVDAGYPGNADLVIEESGQPVLKRRRGRERRPSALALERLVEDRMPERSILDVLTRTAFWLRWYRHFGPLSGSHPKLADPLARYVVITFTYGTNMGPYQASRHLRGLVSPHETSAPANQHITPAKLNLASTDVINEYARLDLTKLWGDGSQVATDGTQMDTWADNLLAESHIRYGGYGGIAFRYVSDTYIALFSRFIPCGVWEAVYVFDGLLQNQSEIQPGAIHTDTQGQTLPAFGLAEMLGLDLLPRIRNWQGLIFYRPSPETRYEHIDALFGDDPRNAINWKLIEAHWVDLVRTVISIREGRVSSVVLLRRLRNDSRKNRLYRAFRELGRVTRTIVLLRYLSEPELREGITAITNRAEAFHGFAKWLTFGHAGVISDNDPDTMEKIVKVQRAAGQLPDLPHLDRHDARAQPARARGSCDRPGRRGHPLALPDQAHPPLRPLRAGSRPAGRPARGAPRTQRAEARGGGGGPLPIKLITGSWQPDGG